MRKQLIPLLVAVAAIVLLIGAATSNPAKYGGMVSTDGTGNPGTWVAMTGTGTPYTGGSVQPAGLMVSSDGTGNPGTWVAATPSTFSGGGASLSANNTWTGSNTFNGGLTVNGGLATINATTGSASLGLANSAAGGLTWYIASTSSSSGGGVAPGSVCFYQANCAFTVNSSGVINPSGITITGSDVYANYGNAAFWGNSYHFGPSGSDKWMQYSPDANLYIRDTTNGVMQVTCTPGAAHAGICSTQGPFQPYSLGVGSTQQTTFDANGVKHEAGTAPTSNTGTLTGTNHGGYITGLSSATSVTITFANSGWNTWSACTASPSVSLTAAPYVSSAAPNKTAVTFTFPSLTGALYYNCNGN